MSVSWSPPPGLSQAVAQGLGEGKGPPASVFPDDILVAAPAAGAWIALCGFWANARVNLSPEVKLVNVCKSGVLSPRE